VSTQGGLVASSTVEQYLKTMFLIERRSGTRCIPMKTLADAMGVTPGTATSMAKHLHREGLIEYLPRRGTILSDSGRNLAVKVVRRHRLIETFLERILEYDWSEVHSDAEELEHVVSDRFVERVDRLLGYPETDPHGDPIPRPDGRFAPRELFPLSEAIPGQLLEVARLVEDSGEFLQFMKQHGIVPGGSITPTQTSDAAGTVTVITGGHPDPIALSRDIAEKVLVLAPGSQSTPLVD